ncbi:ArnT family glycosyltransferase [Streptomyces lunalinharesii]|uniref:Glycosyltransferase family 39 protein n=1 Tax=Streptomyces lunalinharesii TaxID=333384 RepID=A0ABP6F7V8_9ACTN
MSTRPPRTQQEPTAAPDDAAAPRGFVQRVVRGRPQDPRWARPALVALLVVTAALYLWDLSASKYANQFYSAAVQAGSVSWKAFFFGSSDAANSITVDKPPASLWPMELSVRLFGLSPWAVLVPQALMGVAAVGVLHATVRRRFGAAAGLLSAGALALTPVAALMFRFNNPDAMLCLLMVCAVACVLRALEAGRTKWLVLAGVCFGLAFLTKTLQAWLILPALAVVYACCAPVRLPKRLGQLLLAGLALVASGGWWVAIVELLPASARPYVGGSQTNSFLELTFGYNGLGRIDGNERGSVGGGHHGGGTGGGWGQTGITRLFSSDMGGQISWLLPAALILLVVAVGVLWRARRAVDAERAAQRTEFLVWGGALLMTFTIFSFMSGIFHQYYNIALAPYVAALVGMGSVLLWRRGGRLARGVLAVVVAVTALWSYVLLDRSPQWLPWLRWVVLVLGLLAALGLLLTAGSAARDGAPSAADGDPVTDGDAAGGATQAPGPVPGRARRRVGVVAGVAAGLGVATALAGPLAYTLDTVNTAKGGSIITAGPAVQGGGGFPGGGRGRMSWKGGKGFAMPGGTGGRGKAGQGFPGFPGGGRMGGGPGLPGGVAGHGGRSRGAGGMGGGGGAGGMGGLLDGASVSTQAQRLVERNADHYTWAAAAVGSQNAASYQLATQKPVMAIGGFNGSDPSPTLAQFQRYVAQGRIHYFLVGERGGFRGAPGGTEGKRATGRGPTGGGTPGGGGAEQGTATQISAWVEKTFTKVTAGGATFYDLTQRKA